MCSSKANQGGVMVDITPPLAQIDGRPVLQPGGNRVPISLERRNSLKKLSPKPHPSPPTSTTHRTKPVSTPPISPKSKSPRPAALKRGNDPNGLNLSVDKTLTPRSTPKLVRKKSKKSVGNNGGGGSAAVAPTIEFSTLNYSSLSIVEAPGSIAAARREQMTLIQAQRKMRIAHYGRTNSGKFEGKIVPLDSTALTTTTTTNTQEKRCSFITPNSDPLYVVYHDEEWGVPVHDDKLLFELLVLSGAQVGTDWTSILRKRQEFKEAFAEFDADIVANFSEKQITSISTDYGIDLNRVRGVVDNSKRILEVRKEFGSLEKYLWGFVNHKPINTQYKSCHKMPVKTSKSETISKDMVRRGFRLVGPTVMHSFMQAAGLTNDHLITCPRHTQCIALGSRRSAVALVL
ncbi:Methyladenine glycosylase [Thalictrum thalictroides]|uniref:Methyladenine glycosylase n=1 Tax=Thalictrum thalictroides TaxID=46969 RepID=A0A7J6VJI5_THATH|nr:Methyladenine glycosylase [Thalictrum thalictroides]